jgi:HK97 family phage prohead protease
MGNLKQSRKGERHRAVPLMREVRHWRATGVEVREKANTDEIIVTGKPIVFNAPYSVTDALGTFTETMAPGVAREVLSRGADVRFLFDHEGLPLARSTSGTLSLRETSSALEFEARLDARQQLSNDLAIAISRGDVNQMSCAFFVGRDQWDTAEENRTVHSFRELHDVSAVTYPCSPSTSLEIVQRMALEVPVESSARLRRMYAGIRAGKALSAKDGQLLTAMLGQFDARDPVRSSGRVDSGGDLRRELERLERRPRSEGRASPRAGRLRSPSSGSGLKAEDLRRVLAERERKRREVVL